MSHFGDLSKVIFSIVVDKSCRGWGFKQAYGFVICKV